LLSISKSNLYMSTPLIHSNYKKTPYTDGISATNYEKIRSNFSGIASGSAEENVNANEGQALFFEREPCRLIGDIFNEANDFRGLPEYIISCYRTCQLNEGVPTALCVRQALNNQSSTAFSISSQGALSPVTALKWLDLTGNTGIVVCLEQIYNRAAAWNGEGRYSYGDGLAIMHITKKRDRFRIVAYDLQFTSPHLLVCQTHSMIYHMINSINIHIEDNVIIPHCFSEKYEYDVCGAFPNVYLRKNKRNLSTTDPFVTLSEYMSSRDRDVPNISLSFADQKGFVGLIQLEVIDDKDE